MQSRSIPLSLIAKRSGFSLILMLAMTPVSVLAAEESELQSEDPIENEMMRAEALTERTFDRVLERGLAITPAPPPYGVVEHVDPVIPEPTVVPPEEPLDEEMFVFENGIAEPPPKLDTWIVFQDNTLDRDAESEIFRQINADYTTSACLPGFDCPIDSMELPEWPDDVPATPGGTIQVFDAEDLIPRFDPIPELRELPFPDSDAL